MESLRSQLASAEVRLVKGGEGRGGGEQGHRTDKQPEAAKGATWGVLHRLPKLLIHAGGCGAAPGGGAARGAQAPKGGLWAGWMVCPSY